MPWRYRFKTNEEYNKWYREYRLRNLEKSRKYDKEYNRLWRKENPQYINKIHKYKKSHPIKIKAERLIQYAIRHGKLKRLPCMICGEKETVAHHPNYHKPLKIVFLCKPHHREYHYKDIRKPLKVDQLAMKTENK